MLQVLSSGSWSFGCVCCLREPPSETLVRSFLMINLHNTCYNFVLHIPKPCQLENQTIFCSNGNDPQPPPSMQLWLQAELSHNLWVHRRRLWDSYGCRQSCLIVCVGELKDFVVINFLGPDLVSLVSQSQAMPGRSGSEMLQKHHLKATSRQSWLRCVAPNAPKPWLQCHNVA